MKKQQISFSEILGILLTVLGACMMYAPILVALAFWGVEGAFAQPIELILVCLFLGGLATLLGGLGTLSCLSRLRRVEMKIAPLSPSPEVKP